MTINAISLKFHVLHQNSEYMQRIVGYGYLDVSLSKLYFLLEIHIYNSHLWKKGWKSGTGDEFFWRFASVSSCADSSRNRNMVDKKRILENLREFSRLLVFYNPPFQDKRKSIFWDNCYGALTETSEKLRKTFIRKSILMKIFKKTSFFYSKKM